MVRELPARRLVALRRVGWDRLDGAGKGLETARFGTGFLAAAFLIGFFLLTALRAALRTTFFFFDFAMTLPDPKAAKAKETGINQQALDATGLHC
ncbi:MAG TPA: hypothetical protein VGU69_07385 [Rhizomicrobium sp.]|nr:hypothetical protein [Rhizomicrobium sp.]